MKNNSANNSANIERIVIIDHETHSLFIEDVDEDMLAKDYNGNEEDYIVDNYSLSNTWSWDYIVSAQYFPHNDDPIDVEFTELI